MNINLRHISKSEHDKHDGIDDWEKPAYLPDPWEVIRIVGSTRPLNIECPDGDLGNMGYEVDVISWRGLPLTGDSDTDTSGS